MQGITFAGNYLYGKDNHPGILFYGDTTKKSDKPQDELTDWGDIFSKLTYWYGLQYTEIADMPMAMIDAYLGKLEVRKAETKLMLVDVESIPHMKPKDRKNAIHTWMKIVQIETKDISKPATPARLKMMGIGVRYVKQ